jgi:hypothetical protein
MAINLLKSSAHFLKKFGLSKRQEVSGRTTTLTTALHEWGEPFS